MAEQGTNAEEQLSKAVIRILNPASATRLKRREKGTKDDQSAAVQAAEKSLRGEAQESPPARSSRPAQGADQAGEITVQFNPSGIRYSDSIADASAMPEEGAGTGHNVMGGGTRTMSVELVFVSDDMEDETVRMKIDKFLALIMRSPDRRISFSWGETACTGKVTGLSAAYDAFSPAGNPLHGTVRLTVTEETDMKCESFDKSGGAKASAGK